MAGAITPPNIAAPNCQDSPPSGFETAGSAIAVIAASIAVGPATAVAKPSPATRDCRSGPVATSTSWPAASNARPNGTNGVKTPSIGVELHSTLIITLLL